MKNMNVLIMCEESQAVCKEFRSIGHNAFSNDIIDCSGGHPEWHIKLDCLTAAKSNEWDLKIAFPPCTDLSCSGSGSYKAKRLSGQQEKSINFFLDVWELAHCVENPKNIMSGWKKKKSYLRRWFPNIVERMLDIRFPDTYTQSIQPHMFGHGETKETWLWLKGLSKLIETDNVLGREQRVWRMGPSPERSKLRSKTYQGIAKAMANQWSNLIKYRKYKIYEY